MILEEWNGAVEQCVEQLWNCKEESIRDMKWKPVDQRASRGAEQIRTGKVKQRSISKNRTEFCLWEQGIGDECGKVPVLVQGGEELVNGEIRL